MITGPIRTGDLFLDEEGREWKVIRVLPFGKLDLFHHAGSLFNMEYTRDFRNQEYTRVLHAERNA